MEIKKILLLILFLGCLTILLSVYLNMREEKIDNAGQSLNSRGLNPSARKGLTSPEGTPGSAQTVPDKTQVGIEQSGLSSESSSVTPSPTSGPVPNQIPKNSAPPPLVPDKRLEKIIDQLNQDGDREKAFSNLVKIKDELEGENLQTLMKEMHRFSDLGGNKIILETIFNLTNGIPNHERARILSYINPEKKLTDEQVLTLADAYAKNIIPEASEPIFMMLSHSGGDYGARLMIDMINSQKKDEKYLNQIRTLGFSKSSIVDEYLNKTLDELIQAKAEEQDSKTVDIIRGIILQRKAQ